MSQAMGESNMSDTGGTPAIPEGHDSSNPTVPVKPIPTPPRTSVTPIPVVGTPPIVSPVTTPTVPTVIVPVTTLQPSTPIVPASPDDDNDQSPLVAEGDGSHLTDVLANGKTILSSVALGFGLLGQEVKLGDDHYGKFNDSIAEAFGVADIIGTAADEYEYAVANGIEFSPTAGQFANAVGSLNAASNVFDIIKGAEYLYHHQNDDDYSNKSTVAINEVANAAVSLTAFTSKLFTSEANPVAGLGARAIIDAATASRQIDDGDYLGAVKTISKDCVVFGFAGIGFLEGSAGGLAGAEEAAGAAGAVGAHLADLASATGVSLSHTHFSDSILSSAPMTYLEEIYFTHSLRK